MRVLSKKIAENCQNKKLKVIPWQIKIFSVTYYQNPKDVFCVCKDMKNEKCPKIGKLHVLSKTQKIRDVKMLLFNNLL